MNDLDSSRRVLVVNCGSSSIKYRLYQFPGEEALAEGRVERIGEADGLHRHVEDGESAERRLRVEDHRAGMRLILDALLRKENGAARRVDAVGHRVVHGGDRYTGSVPITDEVVEAIDHFADLAPLHNPPNLTGIRAAREFLPGVPQVACFDTAFHATLPPEAYLYALPYALYERYGVRRYGFHGTSHRYVARRAAELLGLHKYAFNGVTCHLGNGSSLAAVRAGRSVDTTMGLTPLEGLVMGTRSGDVDPAVLLYLLDKGYDADRLNRMLNEESGLIGLSGVSNDVRTLHRLAADGHARARLALDVFSYRLKRYIGAYLAILGRADAVVFTGGIGENAAYVRAAACEGLAPLGVELDEARNEALRGEGAISRPGSRVAILVVPTDEEWAIAADTYRLALEQTTSDHVHA